MIFLTLNFSISNFGVKILLQMKCQDWKIKLQMYENVHMLIINVIIVHSVSVRSGQATRYSLIVT